MFALANCLEIVSQIRDFRGDCFNFWSVVNKSVTLEDLWIGILMIFCYTELLYTRLSECEWTLLSSRPTVQRVLQKILRNFQKKSPWTTTAVATNLSNASGRKCLWWNLSHFHVEDFICLVCFQWLCLSNWPLLLYKQSSITWSQKNRKKDNGFFHSISLQKISLLWKNSTSRMPCN